MVYFLDFCSFLMLTFILHPNRVSVILSGTLFWDILYCVTNHNIQDLNITIYALQPSLVDEDVVLALVQKAPASLLVHSLVNRINPWQWKLIISAINIIRTCPLARLQNPCDKSTDSVAASSPSVERSSSSSSCSAPCGRGPAALPRCLSPASHNTIVC